MNLKLQTSKMLLVMVAVATIFNSCKKGGDSGSAVKEALVDEAVNGKVKVAAASHFISAGSITDHADASIPNSIAWYLATYGGGTATNPVTYYLSESAVYNAKKTIVMPEYARLTEASGVEAFIQCDPVNWNNDYKKFFSMKRGSYLLHVELRLNWKATIGIYIESANDVKIIDVRAHASKKSTTDASVLIYATQSSNLEIRDCLLRRAGCESNETNFERRGYFISLIDGSNIEILNNDMSVCGSSGIGFVKTTNLNIEGNRIDDTGRALIANYISDGITSYHNELGTLNRVVFIKNNTISNSRNHGIHVSGYGYSITGNTITNSTQTNIFIGDQKSPADCSADVWITGNYFGPQGASYSIWRRPVITSRMHIANNTGSTSLQAPTECN